MYHFHSQEEYRQYMYTRSLRKTSNGLGIVLLVIFAAEIVFSLLTVFILRSAGISHLLTEDGVLSLLENGLLSSILFFALTAAYALIKKKNFASLFPFEKVGAKTLAQLCVIGIAVSLMSNFAAEGVTEVFGLFGVTNRGGEILTTDDPPSVLMYYLTVAIMPAFTEEFAFRGVIMGSLRKYSDGLALVVSSALFALMHGNFVQTPFTFCCGLAFGFLVLKTNSMLPAIIVHFLNNGLSVTFDILYKYNVMSLSMINLCYGLVFLVSGVLAFIFIRGFIKQDKDFFRFNKADDVIPYRTKLKTVAGSPTLISFAVLMLLFSVYILIMPYLNVS